MLVVYGDSSSHISGGATGSHVTGSDVTGSDMSHVTGSNVGHCPEACSAHAQPDGSYAISA